MPPAPARPRSAPPRWPPPAAGRALVRWTPSRRARDVSGSAARCIASASAVRPAGPRRSRSRRRARSCRPPPSSATRPPARPRSAPRPRRGRTKSCRVGNTNAWQAWKAPLRTWWSTVPRKVTVVLDAQPAAELDQGLPLGAFSDDPQGARAELPSVDRQGADHEVDALPGDEPAGADEQRRPVGTGAAAGGRAARSAGMPASHQPTMILSSGTLSVRIR